MHDLSLKPGRKTSEFLTLVATVALQWVVVLATVLTDLLPVLPEDWKPAVLIAVSALTSLQAVIYNLKRNDLKKAAVEAVDGYNRTIASIEKERGQA